MWSVARFLGFIVGGAVIGLVVAVTIVFWFVDSDMVLPYYVLGIIVGALVGVVLGVWQSRGHRVAPANDR